MVTPPAVKFPLRHCLFAGALTLTLSAWAQPEPAASAEPMVGGAALREVAQSRIETPPETHWIGELFPLSHRVTVAHGAYSSVATDFDWTPDDLIFEEWSAPVHTLADGIDIVTQATRAYTKTAGATRLPNTKQNVTLVTQTAGDRTPVTDKFVITTVAPLLRIRELPTPAPSAFAGAVGDFTLESRLTSTEVREGDSVTWTLELKGAGNWPEITRMPARVVPKDFQGVAPILKREFKPGSLFEGSLTEDVLLLPTKAGSYQIGPVRFVFFDPKEGKYQLVTTETFTLTVGLRSGGAIATAEQQDAASKEGRTPVPAAPPLLPLDPLPASAWGAPPLGPGMLRNSVLLASAGLLLYWLGLAAQRSQLTDPLHARRRARAKLVATLRELERTDRPAKELRQLVFTWQLATAELGGVTFAMPTARQIAHAIEGARPNLAGSSWAQLWRESNRALYGQTPVLPADWVLRAKAALDEFTIARVPLRSLFLARNLLPFAAAALVLLCVAPGARASGADEYAKGDFTAAEKTWRKAAAVAPLDAHARYNLSLAAAQQNHWSESVAHSLAAFCLEPRNPSIRWQFALSLERSGIDNPAFSGFVGGTRKYRLARQFSPYEWDLIGIGASFATALAAGGLLRGFYLRRSRRYRWTAGLVTAAAALAVLATVVSLGCYGPLADRSIAVVSRNVLLCSVPTEIDTTQKTVPLPAGSLARVDRGFLGWSRLVFANGQTGWVRSDWVTKLYQ